MSDISEKNKKNEILDAYHELLKKVQNTKEVSHQDVQRKQQDNEVVVKAARFDVEHIVGALGQVKVMVAQSVGELEKKLVEEYTRLSELQDAVRIENKNLEELHQIKKNADSLAALLLAQKECKASFEEKMAELNNDLEQEINLKKLEWKLEKERHDKAKVEYDAEVKRARLREEEDYKYAITHERKKDKDAYDTHKSSLERGLIDAKINFEKECSQREFALSEAEKEVSELRSSVAKFPQELKQAIELAEKNVREALQRDYKFEMELKDIEIIGDRKLQQQTIVSLQSRIKEQESLIRDLSQKAELASQQVQSIALKALEGATGSGRMDRDDNKKNQNVNG